MINFVVFCVYSSILSNSYQLIEVCQWIQMVWLRLRVELRPQLKVRQILFLLFSELLKNHPHKHLKLANQLVVCNLLNLYKNRDVKMYHREVCAEQQPDTVTHHTEVVRFGTFFFCLFVF